jgi:hypothetical protein
MLRRQASLAGGQSFRSKEEVEMKKFLYAAALTLITGSTAFAGPAFVCTMTNAQKSSDHMEMTFAVTDAGAGKGLIIGNAGSADLRFTFGDHAVNFFEFTATGRSLRVNHPPSIRSFIRDTPS